MRIFNFDDLIGSIKNLYEGKIIPAPVALQLHMWEKEKLDRAYELAVQQAKEDEDNKAYYADLTPDERAIYDAYLCEIDEVINDENRVITNN